MSNNQGEKVSVEISGEMSRRPFKKSVFKGSIKIRDTYYDEIVYYFKKSDSDDMIYSPAKDEYKGLGKAYNEDNLNILAIELKAKHQIVIFPVDSYEEGIKLYNKLKSNK